MENQNVSTEQPQVQSKSPWIWIVVIIILLAIAAGVFYFSTKNSSDDKGTVVTGNYIEMPDLDRPKQDSEQQYNWSTMQQGPYKDKISWATSSNLLKWTDQKTILAEHASVPDVITKDGTLFVYFVDVATDGVAEKIGLIKSTDSGQTWSNKVNISITGLDNKVAVDPAPFLMSDGRIRLYYFDISTTTRGTTKNTIYSAMSSDGVNFTEEAGGRFTYPDIYDPDVIKVGQIWRMYVGTGDQKVLTASSTDGLTFTYEGVAATGGAIPNIIQKNNTYYLFTGGIDIWTSSNGKTFTKTSNRFDAGKLTADPGVAQLNDGSYLMVYKTKEMVGQPPIK
ncbi:MAG: hypothetical protein ACD_83C00018G0002 [uncultured bacterium]|nr:MAG: hypothetical protein ACD_83C00018G0002 [uncultured bacterium]